MKIFVAVLIIVCVAATAGTIIHLNRQKAPPAPAPVVESSPEQTQPERTVAPQPAEPRMVSVNGNETAQMAVTKSTSDDLKSDANAAFSKAMDALASPHTSLKDKRALFKQLKDAGELDQVIGDLKQRAADNPNDAEIRAALGAAYLNKFPVQDPQDGAILGLEADQSFNAALKIDPANWEAQFFKAEAMSFWPSEMNKGQEVIQRFSNLIDQQERMPPQPQFAQAYLLLGDEYQKLGQPDKAQATWQLGAQEFPNNPMFQTRIDRLPAQR